MAIKTFTTGEVLTASDTNTYLANSGLVYVGTTAFNGLSNNFQSVFSATYDNYQILITNLNNASVTTRGVVMKLLSGTTPTSDSTYTTNSIYQFSASTVAGSGVTASTSFDLTQLSSNTGGSGSIRIEMFNPFNSVNTFVTMQQETYQSNISSFIMRTGAGIHNTQSSYNGFQLVGTTDNISGTVTVYGYRKA